MFFLWNTTYHFAKTKTKTKRPSPKRTFFSFIGNSIERTSLPIALWTLFHKKISAGMTVEAAWVLPLFLFFFVNLGSAIEMLRLHGNLQMALWECGNRMCVYGHMASSGKEDGTSRGVLDELGDITLSYTYVKSQITDYVGRDYLEESPLTKGVGGLQFWESDVGKMDDVAAGELLDIVVTYEVAPVLNIPYVKPFRMSNRYYGRLWTGYDVEHAKQGDNRKNVVYVAENADVYHKSPECTHLKLAIYEVTWEKLPFKRNEYGRKYEKCSKCGNENQGAIVYLTKEGEFYHKVRGCSGLKRTIYTMQQEEAAQMYRACSRCGG